MPLLEDCGAKRASVLVSVTLQNRPIKQYSRDPDNTGFLSCALNFNFISDALSELNITTVHPGYPPNPHGALAHCASCVIKSCRRVCWEASEATQEHHSWLGCRTVRFAVITKISEFHK
ncbi:hypothetical protein RRG08_001493 [Elysia crispata]|uniref:Uncharacterized protein n=1 Tax=Elysia crispata TaxID=231223 RepID=A0AAE1DVT0_9GAST|nr:hypothetical protein RRG08_001493 [Elysia crispata]